MKHGTIVLVVIALALTGCGFAESYDKKVATNLQKQIDITETTIKALQAHKPEDEVIALLFKYKTTSDPLKAEMAKIEQEALRTGAAFNKYSDYDTGKLDDQLKSDEYALEYVATQVFNELSGGDEEKMRLLDAKMAKYATDRGYTGQ